MKIRMIDDYTIVNPNALCLGEGLFNTNPGE